MLFKEHMKVLIILGHPREGSFSHALADAYQQGARQAGVEVEQLRVSDMEFNPNVIKVSPRKQHFEEDIILAQDLITWADHLVFVYPTWWGTMPGLLKSFLDRVFTPGFAFEDIHGSDNWVKLLKGKTAQLITTMDTPLWVYKWIHHSPGNNGLAQSTLNYCGISPVKTLAFSPVLDSTLETREGWLEEVHHLATQLEEGFPSGRAKHFHRFMIWFKAIRFQFYPMTWIAYASGAYLASSLGFAFDKGIFWLGFLWIFLLEVATVLTNDYLDYKSDSQNKYYGPFTGGSRVLVEEDLSFKEVKKGIITALSLSVLAGVLLLFLTPGGIVSTTFLMLALIVLALGYTAPPLKLSYRTLGEVDVGITHSLAVILCGFVFQGGSLGNPYPWLMSMPLFFAIIPSIILAGIPDYEADKAIAKKTMPVHFGKKKSMEIAMGLTALSLFTGLVWYFFDVVPGAYGKAIFLAVPHGLYLIYLLREYIQNPAPTEHVNRLLITALTYIMWFALIPLFCLA